jgi:hypothetical protein
LTDVAAGLLLSGVIDRVAASLGRINTNAVDRFHIEPALRAAGNPRSAPSTLTNY